MSKGGHRQQTHDRIKSTLEQLFRWCGQNAKLEETRNFQDQDPDNNMRPDISLFPSNVIAKKLLIDIQITSPVKSTTANISRAQAMTIGREAVKSAHDKNRKYARLCALSNKDFCPAIFESTGYIGCDLIVIVDKIIKNAALVYNIRPKLLSHHFYTSLSICLQYNIAQAITKHTFALQGRLLTMHRHSQPLDYRTIMSDALCTYY